MISIYPAGAGYMTIFTRRQGYAAAVKFLRQKWMRMDLHGIRCLHVNRNTRAGSYRISFGERAGKGFMQRRRCVSCRGEEGSGIYGGFGRKAKQNDHRGCLDSGHF